MLNGLHLAREPRLRPSSARTAMPFVNQERLVLKFPIDLIERVQRGATNVILKSDSNYESCLKELDLNFLEQRRFIANVNSFYKALNG